MVVNLFLEFSQAYADSYGESNYATYSSSNMQGEAIMIGIVFGIICLLCGFGTGDTDGGGGPGIVGVIFIILALGIGIAMSDYFCIIFLPSIFGFIIGAAVSSKNTST